MMSGDRYEAMRAAMVASQLRPNGVDDPALVAVMGAVARERFVPSARAPIAYADVAHPLPGGRALDTPMVTGRLLDALAIEPGERVLVVGAGTGYSAEILRRLGADVTALEFEPALLELLRDNVHGVAVVAGRLAEGAPDTAPYDAMLIEGAIEFLPDALVAQLAPGGRVACGMLDGRTTRLALGRRTKGNVALVPFGDADIAVLADFVRPPSFVF